MARSAGDEKILSYNDVVLRQSDLGILSGPYFLNDRIIEFYFSYLSTTHLRQDLLLVPPSIAFWISNCPDVDGLRGFLDPLKLPEKELIIFPVNDNRDLSLAEGGSHWSLLAYYRAANIFVHHDSNRQMNKWYAFELYKHLVDSVGDSDAASNSKFLECSDSPQQVNGYDCGLYVAAIAQTICHWYETAENKDDVNMWFSAVKQQVTPTAAGKMRNEILGLIRDQMAKN